MSQAARENLLAKTAAVAGAAAAAIAAALAVLSQLDADAFGQVVQRLATDGNLWSLERPSGREPARTLGDMAMAAALIAGLLLLFRRRAARWLATRPTAVARGPARVGAMEGVAVAGPAVVGVFLAARNLSLPMRGDESRTVVDFAAGSLWQAWSSYHLPNNHVLHTMLVWVAHQLAGWEPAALRMPAFLAGCATLAATWWFARREHGPAAAAFAAALLATSPLFLEYASNARGYSLIALCFVLALLCGSELARRPGKRRLWAAYAGAIGLGLFTMPVMALPAAVTACWTTLLGWREQGLQALPSFALRVAAWSGAGLALATALYVPVLIESGAEALLGNKYVGTQEVGFLGYRLVASHTAITWLRWHAATPFWAQAALFATIAVGMVAPRLDTGRRGLLACAVAGGVLAVLVVHPVMLANRMTIFLLPAAAVMGGAGAATLGEAVLARLAWGARVRSAALVAAAWCATGTFGWWATRPGVVEWFARETEWSPGMPTLVAAAEPQLRAGDYVLAWRGMSQVAYYLEAAGRRTLGGLFVPPDPTRLKIKFLRLIGETSRKDGPRFFVFVDDTGLPLFPRFRAETDDPARLRAVEGRLAAAGHAYCVAVEAQSGKVLRLDRWPTMDSPTERRASPRFQASQCPP